MDEDDCLTLAARLIEAGHWTAVFTVILLTLVIGLFLRNLFK